MDPTEIELSQEQLAQLEQDMLEREAQEREILERMDQENLNQGAPEQPQVQQQQKEQPVEEIVVEPQDPETSQNINGETFPTAEGQAILKTGNERLDENLPEVTKAGLAMGAGMVDFAVDTVNWLTGVSPEQDAKYGGTGGIPKIPKFEEETTQMIREIATVVAPNLIATPAISTAIKGNKAVQASKFLNDPFIKFMGDTALSGGIGATVDTIATVNRQDDNLFGIAKKTFPRTYGWIPDSIATLDEDSPDTKHKKNIVGGTYLGIGLDMFGGLTKLAAAATSFKPQWIPDNEKSVNWFTKNFSAPVDETKEFFSKQYMEGEILDARSAGEVIPNERSLRVSANKRWEGLSKAQKKEWSVKAKLETSAEDTVLNGAVARSDALDELGAETFARRQNLDEPILGVHDMFDYNEQGIRTVDRLGAIGASVDNVRILDNIESVKGRLGSIFSEAAIKYVVTNTKDPDIAEKLLRGIMVQMEEAGEYSYKTGGGQLISFQEVMEKGNVLSDILYGKNVAELRQALEPALSSPNQYGIRELTDPAYAGVFKTINRYLDEYSKMDLARTQAYAETSVAGQIADMSEGSRLIENTAGVERAQEQILDRLQFLMELKGTTAYSQGRALNMKNLWNRLFARGSEAAKNAELTKAKKAIEDAPTDTLKALERIKQEAASTIDTLRAVKQQKPAMLNPLLLAYEMTDGRINSITKLNKYLTNSAGVFSKALIDFNTDLPSAYLKAWWSNVYNSTLSAGATTTKAGISNTFLLAMRPINTFAGALLTGDKETMQRGWYQYSAALDTLNKGFDYMKTVWSKSGTDPAVVAGRENYAYKDAAQIEIMSSYADAMALEGKYGPQAMVSIVEETQDMADSPWMRFGTRGMQAFDGFTQAVIGNWEARGRAYDKILYNGTKTIDGLDVDAIAQDVYGQMFNKQGILTDQAVKYAAGEIAFNLESGFNNSLTQLIDKAPIVKPFMLFTKTPINAAIYTSTYNPLGTFIDEVNQFSKKFEEMPGPKVEELLQKRGIKYDASNIQAIYNNLRSEYKGRKAIGMLTVTGAVGLFMNDRLTGNGLYDKSKQRARREYSWKPRSFKGLDGRWHSYDGLGAISDWLALTADIMDNGLDFGISGQGTLRPNDIGENLRAMGFVIGATLTDKTFLSGIEPMMDVLRGDPGAINRWASSFISSATMPGASLQAEIGRLMYPQLKIVDNNLLALYSNRSPFLKGDLPTQFDWIDGGAVNEPPDFWTRIANTYLPWKTNGKISENKQFLIDIGYNGVPSLTSNGRGGEYTAAQRGELTSIMGKSGYFNEQLTRIRQSMSAKEFRKLYHSAQEHQLNPDVKTLKNLHKEVDMALNNAKKQAEVLLTDAELVTRTGRLNKVLDTQLKRGDIDSAKETKELILKYGNN
jgi:hypothetical protein